MCIIICNASLNDIVEGIAYKPHIFSLSGEYFENYSWKTAGKTQHYNFCIGLITKKVSNRKTIELLNRN